MVHDPEEKEGSDEDRTDRETKEFEEVSRSAEEKFTKDNIPAIMCFFEIYNPKEHNQAKNKDCLDYGLVYEEEREQSEGKKSNQEPDCFGVVED